MPLSELETFTVYDHPSDFPDEYVVRRFVVTAGRIEPREVFARSRNLAILRRLMESSGKTCLSRCVDDDPNIVETWV